LNDIDIGACALHIWIVMKQSIMVMMTIRLCYLVFLDVRHLLALPSGVVRLRGSKIMFRHEVYD
jgi:hypothetical protein